MKELLFSITKKDFDITYFSGSGAGGQHRNKHKNCVRLKHKDTGIITTGQEEKSLHKNLQSAFKRMTNHPDFKLYLRKRTAREMMDEHEVEESVNREMNEKNLKVEYLE